MINARTYQSKHTVYAYRTTFKKWEFTWVEAGITQSILLPCPGRAVMASHIAQLIDGSIDRKGVLDGLTRSNINSLVWAAVDKK
jgi:hypothetical protein